jgi:hypothetical protein
VRRTILLLFILSLSACEDEDAGSSSDASASDATIIASDAATYADAMSFADATIFPDATTFPDASTNADAETADAEPADAGDPDATPADAGFNCGNLGAACGPSNECAGGLRCVDQGACFPDRFIDCGGFAGQQCPATHPICIFFMGADYGPCLTREERDCICAQSAGRAALGGC